MKNKFSGISNIKTRFSGISNIKTAMKNKDFPEIGIERDHFVWRFCALGAYMHPFSTQPKCIGICDSLCFPNNGVHSKIGGQFF